MIPGLAACALLLVVATVGCSDEPNFGPIEAVVVHGPAGQTHDAPAMEVVTYRRTVDGRAQGCFGTRPEGAAHDHPAAGSCIETDDVAGLDNDVFAHTSGPVATGLVTSTAAVVRAHLRDGSAIEMVPYPHPQLGAAVFAFTIRNGANIMTIDALDAQGELLGTHTAG